MQELKAGLSIYGGPRHTDDKAVQIIVMDDAARVRAVVVNLTIEDFAQALFGMSDVPCTMELNDSGLVGKTHEWKTVEVPVPDDYWEWRGDEDALRAMLTPFEVDGWEGTTRDLLNSHNASRVGKQRYQKVHFDRWV